MKILAKKNLLPCLTKVTLPFCKHCIMSKQHLLKFNTSNSRSKAIPELVHSDVWRASVTSTGGGNYFVLFINDYSRKCRVYPIKRKAYMFSIFKIYKARVEIASSKNIKCLRIDKKGKYTGKKIDEFCKRKGIER